MSNQQQPGRPTRRWRAILAQALLSALIPATHADQSVTLAWDPNPEPDVAGYIVYFGNASRNYPYQTNVGNVTTATVYGLQEGLTYFFAITATNTSGLESDFSNEVTNAVPQDVTNSVPTISVVANQTILEDSSTAALPFAVGDAETAPAQLVVTAASTNTALLPASGVTLGGGQGNRTVTVRPAANQFGATLVTLTVSDGSKASSTSFLVTVNPVNDPPTVNALADLVVEANSGTRAVALGGITGGPANESQTITVTASSSNPALIPSPTVSYVSPNAGGSLSFTPLSNASGTATITVTVLDNGGSGNGGVDRTSRTFAVTVNPPRSGIELWRNTYFNATDLANADKEATVWGDQADPDHDGRDNLQEYALGMDPWVGEPSEQALLSSLIAVGNRQHQTLTFLRRKNAPFLQYVPEVSADLKGWTSADAVQELQTADVSADFEAVTYQDVAPLEPRQPRYFRLRIIKHEN